MKKKLFFALVIPPKLLLIIIFKLIQVGYTKNISTLRPNLIVKEWQPWNTCMEMMESCQNEDERLIVAQCM